MTNALDGILVVAIEQAVAAPYCSARLREAGARIIKIERAEGDFARGYDSVAGGDSSYFFWLNQGKESLTLDFKQTDDAELLHRLIAKADVLIQNLAPGALGRSGFDLGALRKRHPRLITCDISGYGAGDDLDESISKMKAYDFLVQAEAGLVNISGGASDPGRIGVSVCDIGAGMTAHAGILEALLKRGKTGKGSAVEVSLFGVTADWMTVPLLHYDNAGEAPKAAGLHHPSIAPYGGYQTAEGVVVIAIQNEREWNRFCEGVLLSHDLTVDTRFDSNNRRVENRDALDGIINNVTSVLEKSVVIERLQQADIAYGSINSVAEFSNHPALKRRSGTASSGDSVDYPVRPVGQCLQSKAVPTIGQHNSNIRAEFTDD